MSQYKLLLLTIFAMSRNFNTVTAATKCNKLNNEWECLNGDCILLNTLCDGDINCSDRSDEIVETCGNSICPQSSFRCDYGACIALKQLCDGVRDCVDGSDENSDKCKDIRLKEVLPDEVDEETNQKNCAGWGQMKCWSGQCIKANGKCDGVVDCDDGSDETKRLCKIWECDDESFKCDYGGCIQLDGRCNGTKECWDGSDESAEVCKTSTETSKLQTTTISIPTILNVIETTSKSAIKRKTTTKPKTPIKPKTTAKPKTPIKPKITTENKKILLTSQTPITTMRTTATIQPTTPKTTAKVRENVGFTTTTIIPVIETPIDAAENGDSINEETFAFETIESTIPQTYVHSATAATTTTATTIIDNVKKPNPKFELNTPIKNNIPYARNPHWIEDKAEQETFKSKPLNRTNLWPQRNEPKTVAPNTRVNEGYETSTVPPHYNARQDINKNVLQQHSSVTSQPPNTPSHTKSSPKSYKPFIILTTTPPTTKPKFTFAQVVKKNCTLRDCSSPLICENQYLKSDRSSPFRDKNGQLCVEEGSMVSFSCASGYMLEGVQNMNCTSRGWSHSKPYCIPVCNVDFLSECTSRLNCLYKERNGTKIVQLTERFPERAVKENSQIDFSCKEHYTLEGASSIICKAKGWTSAVPNCTNYCNFSKLGNIKPPLQYKTLYTTFALEKKNKGFGLREGTQVEFSCYKGYKLIGATISICNSYGWSNVAPKCITNCEVDFIAACRSSSVKCILEHQGSLQLVNTILFSCEAGYNLEGEAKRSCTPYGWDHEIPTCKKILNLCDDSILSNCRYPLKCERYHQMHMAFVKINNESIDEQVYIGDLINFGCAYGYVLEGAKSINCLATGWNNEMPTCVLARRDQTCSGNILPVCTPPLNCYEFDTKKPLWKLITTTKNHYPRDTPILFTCSKGYWLKGANVTTCEKDGWTHATNIKLRPQCIHGCDPDILLECKIPLTCTYLRSNQKNSITITKGYKEINVPENSSITFDCIRGYSLPRETHKMIQCTTSGWSHSIPKCVVERSRG